MRLKWRCLRAVLQRLLAHKKTSGSVERGGFFRAALFLRQAQRANRFSGDLPILSLATADFSGQRSIGGRRISIWPRVSLECMRVQLSCQCGKRESRMTVCGPFCVINPFLEAVFVFCFFLCGGRFRRVVVGGGTCRNFKWAELSFLQTWRGGWSEDLSGISGADSAHGHEGAEAAHEYGESEHEDCSGCGHFELHLDGICGDAVEDDGENEAGDIAKSGKEHCLAEDDSQEVRVGEAHGFECGVLGEMVGDFCVENLVDDHEANEETHGGAHAEDKVDGCIFADEGNFSCDEFIAGHDFGFGACEHLELLAYMFDIGGLTESNETDISGSWASVGEEAEEVGG